MNKIYVLKTRVDGFDRKDELIALALFDNNRGYYFDLDNGLVKELHRLLFVDRVKCPRCGGKHTIESCPIRADYSIEKSPDSPKRGSCCDPPKQK